MTTLLVVRVVYVNNEARSVSVPVEPFTGDCALLNANAYIRRVVCGKQIGSANRTEYHILPVGATTGNGALDLKCYSPTQHRDHSDPEQTGIRTIKQRAVTRKMGIR